MYEEIKRQQPKVLTGNKTPATIEYNSKFEDNTKCLDNLNKRFFQHKLILKKAKEQFLKQTINLNK